MQGFVSATVSGYEDVIATPKSGLAAALLCWRPILMPAQVFQHTRVPERLLVWLLAADGGDPITSKDVEAAMGAHH